MICIWICHATENYARWYEGGRLSGWCHRQGINYRQGSVSMLTHVAHTYFHQEAAEVTLRRDFSIDVPIVVVVDPSIEEAPSVTELKAVLRDLRDTVEFLTWYPEIRQDLKMRIRITTP